ncbi:hypothetical protein pipiens_005825 [Culex pipiens pipiens]|uniref:Nuclear receptor-binding factor 2 n=3 Tax=Culex pipiens TaxID=7175 RepID=A0A8D8B534_CULPI
MENSYLNVAHVYSRKAEYFSKKGRYDEAMECHRKTVTNLDLALKISPPSTVILESLQIQKKYHLKQVESLKLKKQQHERYMKALEYQRRRNPEYLAQQMEKLDKYNELQIAIYHNLDDTDTLLESLQKSRLGGQPEPAAGKAPVDELVSLNHALHLLIHKMAQNFDEYATENENLKEKLRLYEKETENQPAVANSLETGRDALEAIEFHSQELPALAPLELPSFDVSGFENN